MKIKPTPHEIDFLSDGSTVVRCGQCDRATTLENAGSPAAWYIEHLQACHPTHLQRILAKVRSLRRRHGAGLCIGAAVGYAYSLLETQLAATVMVSFLAYVLGAFGASFAHTVWRLVIRPAWLVFQHRRRRDHHPGAAPTAEEGTHGPPR